MVKNLSQRCLDFLYFQVQENKIPQIKKNMVEDLEQFISVLLEEAEANQISARMQAETPTSTNTTVEKKEAVNE